MWENLSYRQKNIILSIAFILVVYITYALSIKHTIAAAQLNHQLQAEQNTNDNLGGAIAQINGKNNFYIAALKSYKIKRDGSENRQWQALSSIALAQKVQIGFSPMPQLVSDTTALQKGMVMQQFDLKGNYFNLVKLLDTVSKSIGIGRIAELKISVPKESRLKDGLTARISISALKY